jgi:para-aminobenzoate synthetase component 2
MIDNYDSFVYNLVHYFKELGEEILVFRHNSITIKDLQSLSPSGIILSPGPKTPSEAGICQEIVHAFSRTIPILGVCLGHQVIAHSCGATVVKAIRPMHGKLSRVVHQQQGMFHQIPSPILATRYHSLVVDGDSLPDDFIVTAKSEDGEIMGLKHKTLLLEGVQFHPEAVLTEYGHELLANFIAWCKEVEQTHDCSY